MGNFYPQTPAQFAVRERDMQDQLLLDTEFDDAIDFEDMHAVSLEISNQFTTHTL
jgi:hypothetical protein